MGNLKSLGSFWSGLATNHRYQRFLDKGDYITFKRRLDNEGLTFLTTTLPKLGKALDEFHSTTIWKPPSNFQLDSDSIPIFMGKAIRLALDGNSQAVDCVRQLSYVFYKLEVKHGPELVNQCLDLFCNIDRDAGNPYDRKQDSVADHLGIMKRIISRILCNTDPRDIRPCHGSGATACRTSNEDKWHKLRYYQKLDHLYPYSDYFFYSMTHLADEYEKLEKSTMREPQARVVLVPKDSRGPRIISCEPAELMFIQQGIMRVMYETLQTHPSTRGQINFSDQEVNRSYAYHGSIYDDMATIDLSEASDRLSLGLVRDVFPDLWYRCLEACRSETTILPDGRIVKLNKFAPMGSACCFPVEALVFWASAQATLHALGISKPVYVYGDDIIMDSKYIESIMSDLEMIGLKINRNKSYTRGPFRESCGGDYHFGYDVTPVRVRKYFGKSDTSIATCADLANNLVAKFGYTESLPLIDLLEKECGYVYPRTELSIPNSIRISSCPGNDSQKVFARNDEHFAKRWNKSLQRYEYRIRQLFTPALAVREATWSELLRKELTCVSRSNTASPLDVISSFEPGKYAATHAARLKWAWVWLG